VSTVALPPLQRRRANGFHVWVSVAAVVAVVSAVPLLRLDIDAGSKVALSAMHLSTGLSAIAGHAIARRRSSIADASI
jgi:hypothetical protein